MKDGEHRSLIVIISVEKIDDDEMVNNDKVKIN